MKSVIDYLKRLDLSEIEARIYAALLENGPMNVGTLAHSVGIKRSTAYFYIDPLIERGLVVRIIKKAQKLIALNDPDNLAHLVNEKSATAQQMQKELPGMLRAIHTQFAVSTGNDEVEIKYYKGRNGVKNIYQEALKAEELRSYANLAIMEGVFPENLYVFSDAFKNNKELKMFEIVEDSPASRKQTDLSSKNKRYFYKFLPDNVKLTAADILIYDGKVSIINVRNKMSGVVFQNPEYYNNAKELFDFNWRLLPEVKRSYEKVS